MLGGLGRVIGSIFGIVDKAVPDKALRDQLKAQLQAETFDLWSSELDAARAAIVAEATGESWLQRNWRPVTMLTFTGLVVAQWMGFTADGITPEIEAQLLDIVKVGLGGYVVGRSAEKVAKVWKQGG